MSDTERSIAAEVQRLQVARHINTVTKACAYWYACGYNDHRTQLPGTRLNQPYADATAFAEHWLTLNQEAGNYLPSLQDAFKAWMRLQS